MTAPSSPAPPCTRTTPRWWAWVNHGRICCYDRKRGGHRMPRNSWVFDNRDGAVRCQEWIPAEKRECGRLIYLLAIAGGGLVVVEVDLADLRVIKKLQDPTEILEYLQIWPDAG